jgi:transposase-like protein
MIDSQTQDGREFIGPHKSNSIKAQCPTSHILQWVEPYVLTAHGLRPRKLALQGTLKWTPNLGQVFKWDTVQRNGLPMTETKKRMLHPPELKAKLGLEALGGMKTINQIAQEHDVHPMQVRQWKRDIQDQAKTLFEGKRGPKPVSPASSPDRLYGEIGRLKMELDWLKKKSGISLP